MEIPAKHQNNNPAAPATSHAPVGGTYRHASDSSFADANNFA